MHLAVNVPLLVTLIESVFIIVPISHFVDRNQSLTLFLNWFLFWPALKPSLIELLEKHRDEELAERREKRRKQAEEEAVKKAEEDAKKKAEAAKKAELEKKKGNGDAKASTETDKEKEEKMEVGEFICFNPYTDVYWALYIRSFLNFCEKKNPQANHLGGIGTQYPCIARADVLPLDHRASPLARGKCGGTKEDNLHFFWNASSSVYALCVFFLFLCF